LAVVWWLLLGAGMKPSTLAIALLGSMSLAACATDPEGVDIEVTAAPADGKFDSVAGKQFRFHRVEAWVSSFEGGAYTDLAADLSMKINVATDSTVVVSGKAWGFMESNWPEDHILKLSATSRPGAKTATAMLLVLVDSFKMTPISCGGGNIFSKVALDPIAKEAHVDGKTFTYAQCGLEGARPSIDVFVVPEGTSGALEGEYTFRLNATVE
jgi:hypothetical protein